MSVTIRLRWWVRPYMAALVGFARLTGMQPDWAKVRNTLYRGVVVKAGRAKAYGNGKQEDA